ncbi:MAG: hypothetical protein GY751_17320 [Bacteroidetes bacterium]|nr:hypothetical protein [Bacteroidota bacterium]
MARVAPEVYEESLERDGARPMDFTGRAGEGFYLCGTRRYRYAERPGILGRSGP